jgi:hypothetical protein
MVIDWGKYHNLLNFFTGWPTMTSWGLSELHCMTVCSVWGKTRVGNGYWDYGDGP